MNIKKAKEVKTRKNLIKYKSKMTFKYWMFSFLGSFMAVNNVINFVLKKNQLRLNFHKVILFGEYIFNYKSYFCKCNTMQVTDIPLFIPSVLEMSWLVYLYLGPSGSILKILLSTKFSVFTNPRGVLSSIQTCCCYKSMTKCIISLS